MHASIQVLNKGLHNPEGLKAHKLRDLVCNIVQQLLSSTLDLRVVKVRAHRGVGGNEAADRTMSSTFDAQGRSGRELHWIQHRAQPRDEQLRNTADLKDHLLTPVQEPPLYIGLDAGQTAEAPGRHGSPGCDLPILS